MILVDTNVISEMMRRSPEPRVVAWLDEQIAETLFLSTVSLAELLLGIAVLPHGKRKLELGRSLALRLTSLFGSRLLGFDADAAEAYARVVTKARVAGRPVGLADGQIAAIAETHGLTVATRDWAPFEAGGIPVVNPWAV